MGQRAKQDTGVRGVLAHIAGEVWVAQDKEEAFYDAFDSFCSQWAIEPEKIGCGICGMQGPKSPLFTNAGEPVCKRCDAALPGYNSNA
jgi:hypothetical protein